MSLMLYALAGFFATSTTSEAQITWSYVYNLPIGISHFIDCTLMHFADTVVFQLLSLCEILHFIIFADITILQMEGLWQPTLRKHLSVIFHNICSPHVFASHFGSSHKMSNFSLLLYLLWWPAVSDF